MDPDIQHAEDILRKCVHCGFCTATCPTYLLLGDELDSPRGRIYLIKNMLEKITPPSAKVVKHIDRCLSCLGCITTCPSGVNYMHLVDRARSHINDTFQRQLSDRTLRTLLAWILPNPRIFRLSLIAGRLGRIFMPVLPRKISNIISLIPKQTIGGLKLDKITTHKALGTQKYRVALLGGCAQRVLNSEINDATIRLLTRHGCETVISPRTGCCGAIPHHLGKTSSALPMVEANVTAWHKELLGKGLDAILTNTSGCGTMLKDYGHLLRDHKSLALKGKQISNKVLDISEFLERIGVTGNAPLNLTLAYHSACSLQHGQGIHQGPIELLSKSGFNVAEIPEGHLCCGSAGTYNILQPELALRLRDRKLQNIATVNPDIVVTGNIGCMNQLASESEIPIIHTVQMLDWATGGPVPSALSRHKHLFTKD